MSKKAKSPIRIAAIVTCYNRCEKTLKCLKSLIGALNHYNSISEQELYLELFITDDGCTDNTFSEIEINIKNAVPVTVIKGSGSLYWAGGMRSAWNEARKRKWDYFFLLNDDTELRDYVFVELFNADSYCQGKYQKKGIYSGITCAPNDESRITYGGYVWRNKAKATISLLNASGNIQECDMANANILLVHQSVVDSIGVFYEEYIHSYADFDYSLVAKEKGFPVVVTANICGECEYDHLSKTDYLKQICSMSLSNRKKHFSHPLHSNQDYETLIRRTAQSRLVLVKIGRWINLYIPRLYLWLHLIRQT